MKIKEVTIAKEVKIKIYRKHGVRFCEVKDVLMLNPLVRRARDGKYVAINNVERFLTVIFSCIDGIADIITAYPSSEWQKVLFKQKMRR